MTRHILQYAQYTPHNSSKRAITLSPGPLLHMEVYWKSYFWIKISEWTLLFQNLTYWSKFQLSACFKQNYNLSHVAQQKIKNISSAGISDMFLQLFTTWYTRQRNTQSLLWTVVPWGCQSFPFPINRFTGHVWRKKKGGGGSRRAEGKTSRVQA